VDANLTRAEAILMIQAHALEALYHQLAQRAIKAECLHYLPGTTPYGCHRGTEALRRAHNSMRGVTPSPRRLVMNSSQDLGAVACM
jgi:hypothetical protein